MDLNVFNGFPLQKKHTQASGLMVVFVSEPKKCYSCFNI